MHRPLALILASAAVASCAPTDGMAPRSEATSTSGVRQCFQPSQIQNFTRAGTDQIYVRVLGGGVFSLQSGGCPDLGSGVALAITPASGISDRLCIGDRANITQPSGSFGPGQCIARVGGSLSPADIEALPPARRP